MTRLSIDVVHVSTRANGGALVTLGIWKYELRLLNYRVYEEVESSDE
jgi:hypothetical protein